MTMRFLLMGLSILKRIVSLCRAKINLKSGNGITISQLIAVEKNKYIVLPQSKLTERFIWVTAKTIGFGIRLITQNNLTLLPTQRSRPTYASYVMRSTWVKGYGV